jgi:GT2 family glycosyltransferase
MKLSVILVNYRGWTKLRLCLDSLRCLMEAPFTWEVTIVDNQSADGQLQVFVKDFPEFRFAENAGNFGFANGCNKGARESHGEFLFFLNPDTMVTLGTLEHLLQNLEAEPGIAILTCCQVNDQGKDTRPYGYFLRPSTLTSILRSVYRVVHKPFPSGTLKSGATAMFPEWVSGSAVMISRERFEKLNGWSEDFWMYFEDADLCKRAGKQGGHVALLTDVQIIHNHGGASRVNELVKALTKSEVLISKHVYVQKHFRGFQRFISQLFLVLNNLLLGPFFLAITGIVFFFVPALSGCTKLYANILSYYAGAIRNKTWISPRSVNYCGRHPGNAHKAL